MDQTHADYCQRNYDNDPDIDLFEFQKLLKDEFNKYGKNYDTRINNSYTNISFIELCQELNKLIESSQGQEILPIDDPNNNLNSLREKVKNMPVEIIEKVFSGLPVEDYKYFTQNNPQLRNIGFSVVIANELRKYVNDFIPAMAFDDILRNNNAVVAGGSLCSLYHEDVVNDIDIYMHIKDGWNVYKTLVNDHRFHNPRFELIPPYDGSFFRENNIIGRIRIYKYIYLNVPESQNTYIKHCYIDLILIKDEFPLQSVIKNFDLNFCQIWYDGTIVQATDMDAIINKSGILRGAYVHKLFETLNKFTISRVKKYIARGYKIKYEDPRTCNFNLQINKMNDEEYVFQKFHDIIISYIVYNEGLSDSRNHNHHLNLLNSYTQIPTNFALNIKDSEFTEYVNTNDKFSLKIYLILRKPLTEYNEANFKKYLSGYNFDSKKFNELFKHLSEEVLASMETNNEYFRQYYKLFLKYGATQKVYVV